MLNVTTTTNYFIPKIIHQIAPSDKTKWHPLWFKCQKSWHRHFGDFEYMLWNDKEDIDTFVHSNYPEFSNLYNSFQVHIMKIDFVRLCLLHKHGGIYADMDYFVYKNFYDQLKKDIGFLENLTEEYTSARYENSLMYSAPGNPLIYEFMKYTKTCFIQYRSLFKKQNDDWRTVENDKIINNTTGSGMISEGVKFFQKYFEVDSLDCRSLNNRPASYDKSFFGKHVHTSMWGNEYCNNQPTHLLIKNGMLYQTFSENNIELNNDDKLLHISEFNMYEDYTNGNFLKDNNLEQLKSLFKQSYI